ncbi:hypothetical protein G9A89_015145 [Geosiphon pyriformis]|nr:hypothetical protein G9A89_015145 [Geosiphon pyriformis]
MALFKGFIFNGWFCEAVSIFCNSKVAGIEIVKFVHSLGAAFKKNVWLVYAKHHVCIEKNGLISLDDLALALVSGFALRFSAGVVKLLNITEAFGIYFGFRKSCLFFSGYDKSKPFFLDYEAIVGCNIIVMKKATKDSGFNDGYRPVFLRKKRRGGILEDGSSGENIGSVIQNSHSWSSKTGDTTKSESIDMEEECLVEETSFNYSKGGALALEDPNQTPTGSKIKTMKALGKLLGKIDFSLNGNGDDILLDIPLELLPSIKNLVNVSVCKSFALDIGLDKVTRKSSQEKLAVVRKLFSKVNGFGEASTPSKFAGIIRVIFTSKLSLAQAFKKAEETEILVNSDLKRSSRHSNQTVVLKKIPISTSTEAVCAVLSKFGIIKLIKMQLIEHADLVAASLLYTLPIGTNAHDIWNYVASVGEKTCVIDYYPVSYVQTRCTTVCFNSAESLDAVIETTPVLKGANLCWSHFVLAKCAGCGNLDYTSLICPIGGKKNIPSGASLCKPLSNLDKSRLAAIYTKHLAPVAYSVSFGSNVLLKAGSSLEIKPISLVFLELDNRFAALECSLTSLTEYVNMLAKRLETPEPMVFQLSPGLDIVISESLGVAAGGETVVEVVVFDPAVISKMEETLNNFSITVMSFSAKLDNAGLNDIICWHKEKNNLVFIFTKSKLKEKICSWIVNKFDGMQVFTSGLESGNLGAGVVVVMKFSLAKHVCKILEVSSRLLSIKLLFKNKLSVSILGLYAGNINSLIAKTVNESSFVILSGDFNEDSSHKCANFKKYLDFGLVNALNESSSGKLLTWFNSQGVAKTIDYVFIFSNLVNTVLGCGMFGVLSVLVGLGGLLDYNYKNANVIKWVKFKGDTAANAAMFHDEFLAARIHSNLDVMWAALRKVLCLSAKTESSKFHKLELLVSKLVKASCLNSFEKFMFLLDKWESLDLVNASVVKSLFQSDSLFDAIWSVLSNVRKSYCSSKMLEVECVRESRIRLAIDKRIESFELNKDHTIRSVLKCFFCKMTLDHLVMDNKLVLKPDLVRTKVDVIIEGWTRKHNVVSDVSEVWHRQYQPLEYVFNEAFSGVMCSIDFDEMSNVISNLPDGKAAGLTGISNELWKHYDRSVLDMLLVLLNFCLDCESVSELWKEAWMLIIPKPYEWEGVFMNTHPIALIETAHKILPKILSDRIFFACNKFDVLRGNNFSVLKGTTTQSPIFAIGSVIKNALEKNHEL